MPKGVKKGKLQAYNQWTPEYTKTGKLTKRSQKRLDAIRNQALGEKVIGSEIGDFVDIAAFAGLAVGFYYKVNPFLYQVLAGLADIAGTARVAGNVLWDYVVKGKAFELVLGISAPSEEDAKKVGDQLLGEAMNRKNTSLNNKRKQVERWTAQLVETRFQLGRPIRAEDWPQLRITEETLVQAIADVEAAILKLEAEIDAKEIDADDAAWLTTKADAINFAVSMGEAGIAMWFFKTYTFSDAVENLTITG